MQWPFPVITVGRLTLSGQLLKLRLGIAGNHVGQFADGIRHIGIDSRGTFAQQCFGNANGRFPFQAEHHGPLCPATESDDPAHLSAGLSAVAREWPAKRKLTGQHGLKDVDNGSDERADILDLHRGISSRTT